MSAALLAKLKVKKPPQLPEDIEVVVPVPSGEEEVEITTRILDKTKGSEFDRDAFLQKIGPRKVTKRRVPGPSLPEMTLPPPTLPKKRGRLKLVPSEPEKKGEAKTIVVQKRRTAKPIGVVKEGPVSMLRIGDTTLAERKAPREPSVQIRASSYYMDNREIFINFMSSLFGPYKQELLENADKASCERDDNAPFSPMPHQKIVRDYINLFTPYRGLLLYHGLGSGKTCSSIAIAEGMKTSKQIIVMTPASLRTNYVEELKKCGDALYRKNQFWEFINVSPRTDTALMEALSNVLSISVEYIKKQGGAWLVNVKKRPNFQDLDAAQKRSLDEQLDEMIRYKYRFYNYNGMRNSHLQAMTKNYTENPFDNAVVIIDEAHNFVSRIVNKLGKDDTLSGRLYQYLMDAHNARIILLTGTPVINYPNEIAIMFNILRGKIRTWSFKLTINRDRKVSKEFFESIFKSTVLGGNIMDYLDYSPTSTTLLITRNPFGFVNKTKRGAYEGVRIGDRGEIGDEDFVSHVVKLLSKHEITVNPGAVRVENFKALPDTLEGFKSYFIDEANDVKNMGLFKRRILGLTSYFRSAQEGLMPAFEKSRNFHIVTVPMSDFQFGVYEEARIQERKLELANARKKKRSGEGLYEDTVSTYRIFSRAFCNFVFPKPDIKRPLPGQTDDIEKAILEETADEDVLDAASVQQKLDNVDGRYEADDLEVEASEKGSAESYEERIKSALKMLDEHKEKYLSPDGLELYSPKFLSILENIRDVDHRGLHLIYSQFRTLEGIGIMKLVLEANGFAQFKITKDGTQWRLDLSDADKGKPLFALYTGTESREEKEIIRNVFNSDWKYIPPSLRDQIQAISSNNFYGEIIKVLMITASGAEGISLKNVRYVHITEPYWHPVRMQQVIGRARRICSHQDLPETLRTVDVFLYLMKFSKSQLDSDEAIELRLKDKSKIDNITPVTSDQALYEIATMKEEVTEKILLAVKEASFDCSLHAREGDKEQLKCFSFGSVDSSKFSYLPSYSAEEADTVADRNKTVIQLKAVEVTLDGIKYAFDQLTGDVYDLDSYKRGQPVKVGTLEVEGDPRKKGAKYIYRPI